MGIKQQSQYQLRALKQYTGLYCFIRRQILTPRRQFVCMFSDTPLFHYISFNGSIVYIWSFTETLKGEIFSPDLKKKLQ